MAFLDDFPEKAKEFAGTASEKAKDLADAAVVKAKEVADNAKLTAAILSEQRALDKSYKAIGEWYLSQLEGDAPEAIADVVAAAQASQTKLEELRAARQKTGAAEPIPVEHSCPLCGAVSDGKFCPQCGAPMGD